MKLPTLTKIILTLSVFIFISSFAARVFVVSFVSTKGSDFKRFEDTIANLDRENRYLNEKISEKASLSRVKTEALAQGMTVAESKEFLTAPTSASTQTINRF